MKKFIHTSALIYLACYAFVANRSLLSIATTSSPFITKNTNNVNNQENQAIYKTKFEHPSDFDINSLIKIYYKGNKLPLKEASFMLQEDANANIFNILFTEAACPEFVQSCTPTCQLSHIKTQEGCESRYFHLSRKNPLEPEEHHGWYIKEITITKHPFKIPLDRTIIILMNLAHLARETQDIFKNTDPSWSKTIVSLPTIIIQHLLDKKDDETASVKAQLSAIDLNTVHTTAEDKQAIEQRGSTVIIYNKNRA